MKNCIKKTNLGTNLHNILAGRMIRRDWDVECSMLESLISNVCIQTYSINFNKHKESS